MSISARSLRPRLAGLTVQRTARTEASVSENGAEAMAAAMRGSGLPPAGSAASICSVCGRQMSLQRPSCISVLSAILPSRRGVMRSGSTSSSL